MKKAVVLVLVLIVVFSSQLFSETLDCQQSFELGKNDAKEEHKVWGWYLLGVGSSASVVGIGWFRGGGDLYAPWNTVLLGVAAVTAIVPFIPALLFPRRENISRPVGAVDEVDMECYRDGYTRRARLKNAGAVLLGDLTVSSVEFLVTMIIVFSFAGV